MKRRDASTGQRERCRVVIKARPTSAQEEEALGDVLRVIGPDQVVLHRPNPFEADRVYLPRDGDAVYDDEVKHLISSLFQGINATVFAYGASGSGKTYTVLGEQRGIVDRVAQDLFDRYDPHTCKLTVMVEELYEERFTDLLPPVQSGKVISKPTSAPTPGKQPITPRQRYKASELEVSSSAQLSSILRTSLKKRRTAATCINERSSRSHVVVTLTLTQHVPIVPRLEPPNPAAATASSSIDSSRPQVLGGSSPVSRCSSRQSGRRDDGSSCDDAASDCSSEAGAMAPVTTYLIGKLYLVDLAGSENIKRSGAEGQQLKEASAINKSLCHLKTVIEGIFKGDKVSTYRNSKLTFCLQDALGGGNSKLLVIACISTARSDLAETKETLRFAEMARSITNTPVVNTQPKDELIRRLEREILVLQDQLQQATKGNGVPQEILQQLNAVETAYAELQEGKEAVEQHAAAEQKACQQQISLLQQQLERAVAEQTLDAAAANERETQLKLQLEAARASVADLQAAATSAQLLLQQLQHTANSYASLKLSVESCEYNLRLRVAAAKADAARELAAALDQASTVQQQLVVHQAEALQLQAASGLREAALQQDLEAERGKVQQLEAQQTEQRKQIQELLADKERLLSELAAAHSQVTDSSRVCSSLQQQLELQQAATDAARTQCLDQQQEAKQLQLVCNKHVTQVQELQTQLRKEQQTTAVLKQQLQEQQSARTEAVSAMLAAHTDMQQCSDQVHRLQQRLQQQQCAVLQVQSTRNGCLASAEHLMQQLAMQEAQIRSLQQAAAQQQQQMQAEQEAAAQEALRVAAQQQQECESWQHKLDAAKALIAQLQQQSAADAVAHAEAIANLEQQHQQELTSTLQHTVQKANTEKLRCKQHLALQVQTLISDAQLLSEALAHDLEVHPPLETPVVTPTGSAHEPLADESSTPAAAAGPRELFLEAAASDAEQQVQLQAEVSGTEASADIEEVTELEQNEEEDVAQRDRTATAGHAVSKGAEIDEITPGCEDDSDDEDYIPTDTIDPRDAGFQTPSSLADADLPSKQRLVLEPKRCAESITRDRSAAAQQSSLTLSGPDVSSAELGSPEPADSPMIGKAAVAGSMRAAAAAAGTTKALTSLDQADSVSGDAMGWPRQYVSKDHVDEVLAAIVFNQLTGKQLHVFSLVAFLADKRLGGEVHSRLIWDDKWTGPHCKPAVFSSSRHKKKHELVQDLMAWYTAQGIASVAAAAAELSNNNSSQALTAASEADSLAPATTPGPTWDQLEHSPCAALAAAAAAGTGDSTVLVHTPSALLPKSRSRSGDEIGIEDLCTPVGDKSRAGAARAGAESPDKPVASSLGSRILQRLTPKAKKVKKKKKQAAAVGEVVKDRSAVATKQLATAAAAGVDTAQPSDKQQQGMQHSRIGPLALAAAGGASAVAEGVLHDSEDLALAARTHNQHGDALAGTGSASSLSAVEQFLLDNCSPGSLRVGSDGRIDVSLDDHRPQAAGRRHQRVAGGLNVFSMRRRATDIQMSRKRR